MSAALDLIRKRWPDEFRDGARCAFGLTDGSRDKGGYPLGFHNWTLDRRNTWWAGFNCGRCDRIALEESLP
jgi:hypothetical protein